MIHPLHSVDSLALSSGGLSLAVSELSSALAKAGYDGGDACKVHLICRQCDLPSFSPDQVELIPAKHSAQNWLSSLEAVHRDNPISLIHQHGIWVRSSHTTCTFATRHKLPLVISPHGMLEPWALKHHAWRKKIALVLYQTHNLRQALAFHATCEVEAEHIRNLGFDQPIAVIANGVAPPLDKIIDASSNNNGIHSDKRRTALFLSRLHPKKGVPMLLEAWARINPPDWKLLISGNEEGNHLSELKRQAQQLGLSSAVTFQGPLFNEEKAQAFQQADLFILPSHSENFGIVIAEALSYKLPVITTHETPWQILEERNCGWWVDASVDAIAAAMDKAFQLDSGELNAMGQRGSKVVAEQFIWSKIAQQMLSFYLWLVDKAEKPDYVI